jgi:ATP-binding cassette subfamily C protein
MNIISLAGDEAESPPSQYTWRYVLSIFARHRRDIIAAHIIAINAALLSVPVPLLLPLLVDEVLLDKPGRLVGAMNAVLPDTWQRALGYVLCVFFITVCLRLSSLALQVWHTRKFSLVAKDLIYRIRKQLIERLQRVSMSEYESLGGSTVSSHLVVDLNTIDEFTGNTVSRFVIALFTLVGAAVVLLWMHWQLGLFILIMNPVAVYFTLVISKKVKQLKHRENSAFQVLQ